MTTPRQLGFLVSLTLTAAVGCAADEPDDVSVMETFTEEELAARPLHDEVTADTVPIAELPEVTVEPSRRGCGSAMRAAGCRSGTARPARA